VTNLDKHWRESGWENERLREKRETKAPAQRVNALETTGEAQGQ